MSEPPYPPLPPELNPRGHTATRPRAAKPPKEGPVLGTGLVFRRSRGTRVARFLSWVAVITSLAVLTVSGVGWILYQHYNGNLTRIGIRIGGNRPPPSYHAENFLLVGSDTRAGQSAADLKAENTTAHAAPPLSDTVILAHLSSERDKAVLVSFPRDSWVQIPEWTDPKTGHVYPAHFGKLNSAFSEGGLATGNPGLLIKTIEQLTGEQVRVDHYVEIDFKGFRSMVDSLGGVNVCVSENRHDPLSGDFLTAGRHHLNGSQALAFVRDRHSFAEGDIHRIQDQQQFIGAIVRQVLSVGTLLNPFTLTSFLSSVTKNVTVDQSLSGSDLLKLARRLRHADPAHVQFMTVPIDTSNGFRSGQSVVLLNDAGVHTLFSDLARDVIPGTTASATVTIPPSSIRVQVLNGTGVAGKAHTVAAELQQLGFNVVGVGTAPTTQQTIVRYGPSRTDSQKTVVASVPGSVGQEDPRFGGTITLIIGSDFGGVRPVKVQPPTTSTVAPPATSAAKPVCT